MGPCRYTRKLLLQFYVKTHCMLCPVACSRHMATWGAITPGSLHTLQRGVLVERADVGLHTQVDCSSHISQPKPMQTQKRHEDKTTSRDSQCKYSAPNIYPSGECPGKMSWRLTRTFPFEFKYKSNQFKFLCACQFPLSHSLNHSESINAQQTTKYNPRP